MSATIKIACPQDSKPYRSARVCLAMEGLSGRITNTVFSDYYGDVNFEDMRMGFGKINVNGDIILQGEILSDFMAVAP